MLRIVMKICQIWIEKKERNILKTIIKEKIVQLFN